MQINTCEACGESDWRSVKTADGSASLWRCEYCGKIACLEERTFTGDAENRPAS